MILRFHANFQGCTVSVVPQILFFFIVKAEKNIICFSEYLNLGGGFKYFLCSSLFGERIQFDEHIFQMGWFNHHLVNC